VDLDLAGGKPVTKED